MSSARKPLADTIDGYDAEIAALQESKRETFQGYREQLEREGLNKDAVKAEIEAVKKAIKRRQAATKKGVEAVDAADDLVDEIFAEISAFRAPRATRVEIVDEFDAETGEIKSEAAETSADAEGRSESASGAASEIASASIPPLSQSAVDADLEADEQIEIAATQVPGGSTANVGGDHESVTGDKLETETARPDDEAGIIDFSTASGEPAPLASGSDVEPVAPPKPDYFVLHLRPHCQHPDACGSSGGRQHCHGCLKAHEAAA